MTSSFDISQPRGLTAAAVGPAGHRIFYLQATDGTTMATLRLEKQQVVLLANYLEAILESEPIEVDDADMPDFAERVSDWVVGSLLVAVTEDGSRIVIVAEELTSDPDSVGHSARVALTGGQVAAFIAGARSIVANGRPECPLCGAPMDPDGHGCPRLN